MVRTQDGVVEGTASVLAGQCASTYAMQGHYKENKLTMKGSGGPCPFGFSATRSGDDLVGSTGAGFPLRLSRGVKAVVTARPPDQSLLGTYLGNYLGFESLNVYLGIKVVLNSVDATGVVQGVATVYDGGCAGIYVVRGRFADDQLLIRGTGGPCEPFGIRAKHEGTTLIGTVGSRRLWLSK